ncbi:MAG TPA: calcium-binding protein [Solirubrobacteraceae bacterium]|nr:calcium-binding protein [Solirubrobacteraceae bacterium]
MQGKVARTVLMVAALAIASALAATAFADRAVVERISAGPEGGDADEAARASALSADGTGAVFETAEALVEEDGDLNDDVYLWKDGSLTLVTAGTAQDARFADFSDDGTTVVFVAFEPLTADDDDVEQDYFEWREGGELRLLTGREGASAQAFVRYFDRTEDGARTVFETPEAYDLDDTDAANDIYALDTAGPVDEFTLISDRQVAGTDAAVAPGFLGMSADGGTIWFKTTEPLVPEDAGVATDDIYANEDGVVTLMTPNVTSWALWLGRSDDGTRVFIVSSDKLSDEDQDGLFDIYMAEGGELHLISKRAEGDAPDVDAEPIPVFFDVGFSADGSRAFFETPEAMTAADQDEANDIYERSDGHTSLVTAGTADGVELYTASADGSRVLFSTGEALGPGDAGTDVDFYLQSGGVRTHVTTGPGDDGNDDAVVLDVSPDLTRILFETAEPLLPDEDPDITNDLYLWTEGELALVSPGGDDAADFTGHHVSSDFSRVLFGSSAAITPDDGDSAQDVFLATLVAAPQNTAPPTIGGTPAVGQQLTCASGTWTGEPAFAFAWNRDGAAIAGATAAAHTVAQADAGHALTCTVTATNAGGSATATSAAAAVPATTPPPPPPPPPSGLLPGACANAQVGTSAKETLIGTPAGDRLRGRGGDDALKGRGGDDCLAGGGGKDRLKGGGGADRLTGGKARDAIDAGGGNDRIISRDKRRETVRCGRGAGDRVTADRSDRLIGCERVRRR